MPLSRTAVRLLIALLAGAALSCGCTPSTWREVDSPDGGFRILMQGDPRVANNVLDTPLGKINASWYSIEANDSAFGVGYADYPEAVTRGTPRELFTVVRESWVKRISGTLQGDGTDIKLDNQYPGMEFIALGKLNNRDAYVRGRFYLVGNRLYQVVVFGTKSAMPISDINQFLGSFKLVPRRELATVKIESTPDKSTAPARPMNPAPAAK